MNPLDWIERKRDGQAHSEAEIRNLVRAATCGAMPDYQVAAWLMAAFLNGLNREETFALTLAMRDSGERLDLRGIPGAKFDKHSTGGVGDKVSLVALPIVAAGGVPVLKMSGRGLGFSGGTIDKLESISGLRTEIAVEQAIEQTSRIGLAIVAQTPRLAPADGVIYALRDVTGTVSSIPLIAASILSKKLAIGADALLLDVKVGPGSFMETLEEARDLARTLFEIGSGAGMRTEAWVTDMSEPLGSAVGNALEVAEAVRLLRGEIGNCRLRELCLAIAGRGMELGEAAAPGEGRVVAEQLIRSGAAAAKLEAMIEAQGGDPRIVSQLSLLPKSANRAEVRSDQSGFITRIDARAIGRHSVRLGAGRAKKGDPVDPSAGIVLHRKRGDEVAQGDLLATIHAAFPNLVSAASEHVRAAFEIAPSPPPELPVIHEVIR